MTITEDHLKKTLACVLARNGDKRRPLSEWDVIEAMHMMSVIHGDGFAFELGVVKIADQTEK